MQIPLTSFIDFVLKSGSPKKTCADKIKVQLSEPYEPAKDYYKRFREAVQELHSKGHDKKELDKLIGNLPDKKVINYGAMATGYKKFIGKKDITWFNPPKKDWIYGDLSIPINPEIGLEWGGDKYLIKLYLKSEQPSKDRIASVLALMKHAIPTKNHIHALLDVRNSKLYLFEASMLSLIPLVEAEARSLEHLLS
ncbi:hypothetical protein F0919_14165 [Taibaiella lutea]|uniref:Uncharacterized protein n=1 Tax=Taibaiella lutea TaxID=2608001 RepID=A0A5M6CEQ5_9BACT|nr:hypothetical protein [Taibaiella lutea]KAA5533678.1 hypothetical protein F0919_14165 [Taibaiella lutea]